MTELLGLIVALSLAGEQTAENLLGTIIHGPRMRLAAIGITVALAYGLWALALPGLEINGWPGAHVGIVGVFAGLGSNVVDGLLGRYAPGVKKATVSHLITSIRSDHGSPLQPGLSEEGGRSWPAFSTCPWCHALVPKNAEGKHIMADGPPVDCMENLGNP